eukprot:3993363-Pyramimonas_sp.AAC.1
MEEPEEEEARGSGSRHRSDVTHNALRWSSPTTTAQVRAMPRGRGRTGSWGAEHRCSIGDASPTGR